MKFVFTIIAFAATLGLAPADAEDEEEIGILAALGLTAAEGNTEVSDKGSELEGWMLASGTLDKAATKIAKVRNDSNQKDRKLILLSSNERFDLGAYFSATGNIEAATGKMDGVAAICAPFQDRIGVRSVTEEAALARGNNLRIAQAVIGALKVDTKITGFDIGTPDAALLNLVAGKLNSTARIPSDAIGSVDPKSPLVVSFKAMLVQRMDLERCAPKLPTATPAEKKDKANVEAAAANAVAVEEALIAYDKDAGTSLLNRALLAEPYLNKDFDVLRVKVEKGGGNLITRKNIFLQFGFPGALSVTAGTVVSYRYYTPSTGSVLAAGMLVCRAAERSWHAINAGKLGAEDCQDAGTVAKSPKR